MMADYVRSSTSEREPTSDPSPTAAVSTAEPSNQYPHWSAAAIVVMNAVATLITRFFGPPARTGHALLHRDVGALQLLRHARHPGAVHDRARRERRPRSSNGSGRVAIYAIYTAMVYLVSRCRAAGSPTTSSASASRCFYGGIVIMTRATSCSLMHGLDLLLLGPGAAS